jgi:AcrR family transcriptional regulator
MSNEPVNRRKQHILDAALQVFATKGFEKASVREIATAADLTTGAIYHHYKNKDDLFYDAVKESAYFVHKLSQKDVNDKLKTNEEMLAEISSRVRERMSKAVEQRLMVLLTAYALSKGGNIKEKYRLDYKEIINRVAEMYFYAFGIDNPIYQKSLAAILVAALDGMAIQYSLGVLKLEDRQFKDTFVSFFAESIPAYLRSHSK